MTIAKTLNRFSVVMAVYRNDNPVWIRHALESILNQTYRSNDIVIVRDGTVSKNIENILKEYEETYDEVKIVRLSTNVGAGQARNEGVKCAKNELVAIMDADDLSLPNRFELQLAEFKRSPDLALVGGQISEFKDEPDSIVGYRKVPTNYDAIKKFAHYRSPINHVTVMFKKSVFLSIGGYPKMSRAEDYYMVSSLLFNKYMMNNLDSTLVNCRTNSDNIRRRKTFRNVHENIISRWKIYRLGAISFIHFFLSSTAQVGLFIMPVRLINLFFGIFLRSKHE